MVAILFPCQFTLKSPLVEHARQMHFTYVTGSTNSINASRGPMFVKEPWRARSKPLFETFLCGGQ